MGHAELEAEDIDESISAFNGALKRTWTAFCATTSIHGLKYTMDVETNKIMRLIWLLITMIMFICAIAMVCTFYLDYRTNPTRLHVENDYAPVSDLYFPAVSICPEVLYNLQRKLPAHVQTQDVLEALRISYSFLKQDERFNRSDMQLMQNVLELNNLSIVTFEEELRWICDDFVYRCRYRSLIVDCNALFHVTKTTLGNCCAFNLNRTGFPFEGSHVLAGLRSGLSVMLFYNENFDVLNSYSQGFRVLLTENNVFPSARKTTIFVPLNQEVFIMVRPEETFCSAAVAQLQIEDRHCVFPNEQPLEFFSMHVGNNCEINFRILNMVKFCGCVTYHLDNKRTKHRVCSYTDVPCLMENWADIIGRFRNTQITCPKSCEAVSYDLSLTSAELQLDMPTIDSFYKGIGKDYTVAHIYINSAVYRRVRHDLLSTTVSLVANMGSAFSLFVGMSMVSVVEIAYYFTVILRKHYGQERRARQKLLFRRTQLLPGDKTDSQQP